MVRRTWVAAQPEERVRQRILTHLVEKLRFPLASIAVERALNQMPHLEGVNLPDRRADIVCFARGIHPEHEIYPLLLLECKAVPLTDSDMSQLMGYNHYLKAPYVALANEKDLKLGWFDPEKGKTVFISYIPDYDQLIRSVLIKS